MFEFFEKKYSLTYLIRDTIFISYPKSGRTWLRMTIAKALELADYKPKEYEFLPFLHKIPDQVIEQFGKDIKVIFLHRHPADSTLSFYHEKTTSGRSGPQMQSSLSDFFASKEYGIDVNINFNNAWATHLELFPDFLRISYEDMHKDMNTVVNSIFDFTNFDISKEIVKQAVEYSSFENMKKIENSGEGNLLSSHKGNFGQGSGRVRSGKVGSYLQELEEDQVRVIQQKMKKSLLYT